MYSWQAIAARTERVYWSVVGAGAAACRWAPPHCAHLSFRRAWATEQGWPTLPALALQLPVPAQPASFLRRTHRCRDDSMAGRLERYVKCGKWFGPICCCVAGERCANCAWAPLADGSASQACMHLCAACQLAFAAAAWFAEPHLSPLSSRAAVDWLYWRFLEWVDPAAGIEPAPDFPPLSG